MFALLLSFGGCFPPGGTVVSGVVFPCTLVVFAAVTEASVFLAPGVAFVVMGDDASVELSPIR